MSTPWMIFLVVVLELLLHWVPWRMWMGQDKPPRVMAYTLGTLAWAGPFTGWLLSRGAMAATREVVMVLWLSLVMAGTAVALGYGLDIVAQWAWERREAREREAALRTQVLREENHAEA